jgi:cytochrome c oxidase subunit 2
MDRLIEAVRRLLARGAAIGMALAVTAWPAAADQPRPWQIGMQPAASPVQADIEWLHNLVLVIITVISLFVAALLVWVIVRYNEKRNPTPSRTAHNTVLEVAWTVIPVMILVIIAIPSFRLIYFEDRTAHADMTIKVTGHQWYWEFVYPDQHDLDIESRVIADSDLQPGQLRLLDVDNQLVLPAGKNIRILTTSYDVIHSFFVPSLGVQRYAIPGRTIETWVKIDRPGVYYGECNQICGTNHSAMPISIKAVSDEEFVDWAAKAKSAQNITPQVKPARLAAAGQ